MNKIVKELKGQNSKSPDRLEALLDKIASFKLSNEEVEKRTGLTNMTPDNVN